MCDCCGQVEAELVSKSRNKVQFIKPGTYTLADFLKVSKNMKICLCLFLQENRDLVTGLKSRTKAGRPNWDKVFTDLREQNRGQITVFYCGNPAVADILRAKCRQFGFNFSKEVF